MDYRELTETDIKIYKEEIQKYMQYRNVMQWSALGSFGGALTFIILMIYMRTINYFGYEVCLYMVIISIIAGISLFILRSAMFNSRINRRRALIRRYEEYHKDDNKIE